MITLQKHRLHKDFMSYFSTIEMHFPQPTNENTKQFLKNHGSNMNKNILWVFLSSYFLGDERKESNTP
jgi:hypothetical protein